MDKGKDGCIVLIIGVADVSDMENEFMKRGYLLPEGCKDLADVLKLREPQHSSAEPSIPTGMMEQYYTEVEKSLAALPPIKEEITIPEQISVWQLWQMLITEKSFSGPMNVGAEASSQSGFISFKPYAPLVFRDLRKMGLCKNGNDMLDFETVSKVLGKYGVTCKLADE
jgi:hypothetical protein